MIEMIISLQNINCLKDNILSIYLKGSKQDMSKVDFWSDTDIIIVLKDDIKITDELEHSLNQLFQPIFAKELYVHKGGIVYRVISTISNGMRQYDLQVLENSYSHDYLKDKMTCIFGIDHSVADNKDATYFHRLDYDEKKVQEIWFKYSECVKKFSRNDNLIGLHLLFDLLKEYLVIEMMKRDIKEQSTVHRFGFSEALPSCLKYQLLDSDVTSDKLNFVLLLSEIYDKELTVLYSNYTSRYGIFKKYVLKSIESLTHKIQ
ncbi:MAG: hypothetical protein JEZ08_10940 [Clostridiales bacterium]|nr:hypothetical protein [Clostridiales bacterium]